MMTAFKDWHSWYVTERWKPLPDEQPDIRTQVELLAVSPVPMPRTTMALRQRAERCFQELLSAVEDGLADTWEFSVVYWWIEDLLDVMETDPSSWYRFELRAGMLRKDMDKSGIYGREKETVSQIIRLTWTYARAMKALFLQERRYSETLKAIRGARRILLNSKCNS